MGKIQVLDKNVSNMIAAGEVVERPASVVKELLENAIDASATHITVEIKNGGIAYIRVTDNGIGMSQDDAKVSLIRHATSKIEKAEDLDAILTLGFRGEALASIAAVSELEIYTKTKEEEVGTHIVSRDGEIVKCDEAGCPVGTTVIVRNLFCTTPARMKFLKKDYTEAGYIADMLNRLALSHPEISFKLINNEKNVLFTAGDNSLKNSVFSVYGKDISKAMINASFEEGHIHVSGLCGKAEISRANRNMQNFFINGRYIKSPILSHALEEAYKNELMVGKFPACVLNITIAPSEVDINVHPTKLEAKFANEKEVYHAVYWAAKNALYQKKDIPQVTLPQPPKPAEDKPVLHAEPIRVEQIMPSKPGRMSNVLREPVVTYPTRPMMRMEDIVAQTQAQEKQQPLIESEPTIIQEKVKIKQDILSEPPKEDRITEPVQEPQPIKADYKICGQIFDTYIIVEKDKEMLLIDQHAAHERLRYEELLRQYENRQIVSQSLLIPVVVDLTSVEMAAFCEHTETINNLGFTAEPFGANSAVIRSTPEDLSEDALKALFIEIITMLLAGKKNIATELVTAMLYQIACKGAIKAHKKLHGDEMKALLDTVFALPHINTCPHGRPITISFTQTLIEKQFKRIV